MAGAYFQRLIGPMESALGFKSPRGESSKFKFFLPVNENDVMFSKYPDRTARKAVLIQRGKIRCLMVRNLAWWRVTSCPTEPSSA